MVGCRPIWATFQVSVGYFWDGDTIVVHSMDRLARNLDDLRRLVAQYGQLDHGHCAGSRVGVI